MPLVNNSNLRMQKAGSESRSLKPTRQPRELPKRNLKHNGLFEKEFCR